MKVLFSGLKIEGKILKINGISASSHSLEAIYTLFKSEEGKEI